MIQLRPKEQFKKSPQAKVHGDLVSNPDFQNVLVLALAEMELNMPLTGNPSTAWDSHCQMVGARKFIETLLNLSEQPERINPPPRKDLVHDIQPPKPQEKAKP